MSHKLQRVPGPKRALALCAAESVLLCGLLAEPAPGHAQVVPPVRDTIRLEAVIVASTRTGRRIEDEPVRVEVVDREEIEEKLLMTPGDIAMLLNETGGVRVQATSGAMGGASVRIQGLHGRYAQILSDGLPLYGEAAGLGPLQIPPMDLSRVEVIKGAASALYGASALGGVINLLSRRPDGEREALVNVTSRGGTDAVVWLAANEEARLGWTLVGGAHRQPRVDIARDGWADIPSYTRGTARPRVFFDVGRTDVMLTAGVLAEERRGGADPDASSLEEGLDTERLDAGVVAAGWLGEHRYSVRGSAMRQHHTHGFSDRRERDRHASAFGELALSGAWRRHTWVVGAAVQHDSYRNRDVGGFDRAITIPGVFVQEEWTASALFAASASVRVDHAGEHGTLTSPRVSLLLRPGEWSLRVSAGLGHHVPSHWIEDIDAIGLGALAAPASLDVERARVASFDVGRVWGDVELNGTVFGSVVTDALALRDGDTPTPIVLNVPGRTRTWGGELLARLHRDALHATASYSYVRATEPDPDAARRRDVALTPRHSAGIVVAWEIEERGRIGFEAYYTGRQALHDNPYRAVSRPFTVFGVLAEHRVGPARVFVNFENIGDVRQTRYDPLLLPARRPSGQRTTDAWAPLDGRVINGGVRLAF